MGQKAKAWCEVWGKNHPAKTKCAAEARAKKEAARLAKHEAKRLRGRP